MSEVNIEVNDVTEQPAPQPEVKRGRPVGSSKNGPRKPVDETYHKKYYLNKTKPILDAKELYECEYCNKKLKYNSIKTHNSDSFCGKHLQHKICK